MWWMWSCSGSRQEGLWGQCYTDLVHPGHVVIMDAVVLGEDVCSVMDMELVGIALRRSLGEHGIPDLVHPGHVEAVVPTIERSHRLQPYCG